MPDALESALDCEAGTRILIIEHSLEVWNCSYTPSIPKCPCCQKPGSRIVTIEILDESIYCLFTTLCQ
ncbi:MAG: hypothetical protein A4E42_00848 [Methanoregulaceae archaeon PtaU1.Bin222]|nr:MAG: hypothetical protein A4E42_00848 [Methanoregulaceae archaeon PtaU1.Bin222]